MKEHPILFSGPMVRAILAGRKTQTRRVMRKQPIVAYRMGRVEQFCSTGYPQDSRGYSREQLAAFCPHGQSGNRLWVRETFAHLADLRTKDPGTAALGDRAFFRADHPAGLNHDDNPAEDLKWRPSIFMPRNLSRIAVEITNVRIERLQDIDDADAVAEGIEELVPPDNRSEGLTPGALCLAAVTALENMPRPTRRAFLASGLATALGFAVGARPSVAEHFRRAPTAKEVFQMGWDSINGKRKGCAWSDNPWVWVIEFKKL